MQMIHQMGENISAGTQKQNAYEKENAAAQLRKQLAEQVRSGAPMSEQDATAAEIDPKLYYDRINHYMTQQAKPQPYTYDSTTIDSLNLPPAKREAALRLKGKEQSDYLALANADRNTDVKETGSALSAKAEERRMNQTVQAQRGAFIKSHDTIEKELQKEQRQNENVAMALKQNSTAADAIVFNYIARAVAGEKGPLSDGDVNRLISKAFEGDVQKFNNWVASGTTSTLSEDQRKAYNDIVGGAVKNFEAYKEGKLSDTVNRAQGDYPLLYGEDGTPDRSIIQRAQKHGYEHRGGGTFEKKLKTTEHAGDYAAPAALAGQIKDPVAKAQAMEAIEHYKSINKPVPQPTLDAFKKAAE
jgi:hypothetical protein